MNEYQKYNLEVKKDLESQVCDRQNHLLSDRGFWGYRIAGTFRCVKCGEWLSSEIVYYYKGDVKKALCYECQKEV